LRVNIYVCVCEMIVSDYMQRSYIEMVNPSFWNSFQISIKRRNQYEI